MLDKVVNFLVLIPKEIFCEPALKFGICGVVCWHEKCIFSIKLSCFLLCSRLEASLQEKW